jgi:hypothetical protein
MFDAGAEGPDSVEGRQGVFCEEVISDGDGPFGEECYEGGPVRDGLVGGDGDLAAQG